MKFFYVFFFSLLIRVFYIFFLVEVDNLTSEDQLMYIELSQSISDVSFFDGLTERVPGYSYFLSMIFLVFGNGSLWVVIFFQILIDSMTCIVIGLLCESFFSKSFFLGGLISAFNLNMIILSGMILTDTLFLFVFSLFLLSLTTYIRSYRNSFLFMSFLLLALATFIRPISYYLIPILLFLLVLWWLVYKKESLLNVSFLSSICLLIVAVILGGIHYRNYTAYNSTSFVSQSGTHLLNWVVPAVYQYSGQGSYQNGKEWANQSLKRAMAHDKVKILPANKFQSSEYMVGVAKVALTELGALNVIKAWLAGSVINIFSPSIAYAPFVRNMDHPSFYETIGNGMVEKIFNYINNVDGLFYLSFLILGGIFSSIFILLAMIGLGKICITKDTFYEVKSNIASVVFMVLIVGYFLAITGPIVGVKYRLPIEPILTIFVVYGLKNKQKSG